MRALLIVNPNATAITPAGRDLVALALSAKLDITLVQTQQRGHATELAAQARANGTDLVIVHGGDGTVNEVVCGILGREGMPDGPPAVPADELPAIAVIPGGSANVFARSLAVPRDPEQATVHLMDLLERRSFRTIGLGCADDRWFLFNAGVGVDAEVIANMEALREKGKAATPSRYVRTSVKTFFSASRREPQLTVHLPGADPGTWEDIDGVHFAFVSNASPWTFLNNRAVFTNPGTDYGTGLGIFASRSMRTLPNLLLVRQMLSARRTEGPKVRHLIRHDDLREVRVSSAVPVPAQVDGDHLGDRTDVRFWYSPERIRVVADLPPLPRVR
ncbi:Diacylglycerol kinase catalytic region OS=Tsukamurella paurometabola (strain ATCC 8368 / DSM/ CCUG 35730 / CIP 100753 / JCM 10117 / KCTC 9821 / NBRC 16120/ NCIMB 702349 / NCTC 13040) OX=521096 GN=Tpau_1111 PE=4 SV=1 [Tsukamurella paurometabola]|uniref:Diacylglycerol kinase catalytic region n=1 Tax=Tsukamurella paurometabola (strain ATCC 8368 / DSM 20162 / CCUG 35730 / CIP 100753 / JCM 10117 / KCTC 9821 / NBRC 16120 / NCIMB 702349 / NCTC 13040) TaxID=521096 RepID=D5UVF3_TSUPD|nr:diacylglycerol kinase family protein [Tsukamurella paurometabola]ADG77743.1 diacylglycerol kinase catalytic region [Tsukamurella paurometabola DSM 20162]SUP28586.1 Putative lipid kinase SP_1045 [Tsukamurella paurometabola]